MIESLIDGTMDDAMLDITFNVRTSPTAAAAATWGANDAGNFYDPSTAFGGQNHGGFALEVTPSAVAHVSTQGNAVTEEVYTFTAPALTDTHDMVLKIGDATYNFTVATGLSGSISAINAALSGSGWAATAPSTDLVLTATTPDNRFDS